MTDERIDRFVSRDDRECFHNLMRQFRDALPDGLKAQRRLHTVLSIVATLVEREREACAEIADGVAAKWVNFPVGAEEIAAAIRAR